jgi:hypothetical protein
MRRIIQTIKKDFSISEMSTDYLGFLQVDRTNNRHLFLITARLMFPSVKTLPGTPQPTVNIMTISLVRQNETEQYELCGVMDGCLGIFDILDDIENYDERQDNMKSLDRTIEIADEFDIYIQLCILHHGMFSATVNPCGLIRLIPGIRINTVQIPMHYIFQIQVYSLHRILPSKTLKIN